ncbi:MAG: CBS domain-containing protein [Acholeplasmataceae bacterium]|jgi:CBS domain-containing protein|nr:CBS domain-containing protein [Acholeplasmataceae bacterium]MDD4194053.1 CBS domain-containing protein [Acholeplasmataceae bacterium]
MNVLFSLTPKEKVAYIYDDYTIRQALEKMQIYRYNSIPILNRKGSYVGTLSEGDLLWYIKDNQLNFEKTESISVSKVPRNKDNVSVSIHTNMEDIIEVATRQNFVPVLDDFGSFIGIITRKDIFNYMVKRMNQKESTLNHSHHELLHKVD